MSSYNSEFLSNAPITAQEKCNALSKTRVTVEFLNIRNNTFYYSGILVILSLIGILFTWYMLTSRSNISDQKVDKQPSINDKILKWILIITFLIIIGLAIYLSINTRSLFNCLSIVTNTLKAT